MADDKKTTMAESKKTTTSDNKSGIEEKAITQAMLSADSSYVPSPSLLAAEEPVSLLTQVDGPKIDPDATKPSVYQASQTVALRAKHSVPIHVTAGGSVVDFEISTDDYDIGFGVTAEREEGVTIVKEESRVESHLESVTGKFLVGSVPCALIFSFDNEYSWFREKRVTYEITVTPPKIENVVKGRRLRAKKALELVEKDAGELKEEHEAAERKKTELKINIKKHKEEMAEKKKLLKDIEEKDQSSEKMRSVRVEQIKMLNQRLEKGWEDEPSGKSWW